MLLVWLLLLYCTEKFILHFTTVIKVLPRPSTVIFFSSLIVNTVPPFAVLDTGAMFCFILLFFVWKILSNNLARFPRLNVLIKREVL